MNPRDGPQVLTASVFGRQVANVFGTVESKVPDEKTLEIIVPSGQIRDIVSFIDQNIPMVFPEEIIGVDLGNDKYQVVYIFWSYKDGLLIHLKVNLSGQNPSIDTTADIFPGFEWHERETHEMFGIEFVGHPDLRLLLLPDELEGKYPLRKSFVTDRSREEESGLSAPRPSLQKGGEP